MGRSDYLHAALWRLTDEQDGVVSREQMAVANLTRSAIEHRVATGRLWPMFNATVFAVGRPQLSLEGRWRAALLAFGESAALSHTTAAVVWRLLDEARWTVPHVTVPTRSQVLRTDQAVCHRSDTISPSDVVEHRGFRVTSLERTHLDLTRVLTARQQKAALREAEYRHELDLGELRRGLDDRGRSNTHGRLRRLLDEWVPGIGLTQSELEARFLERCACRLPAPELQVEFGPYRVDFLWPDARLVVETDGYEAHRGRVAFQRDRAQDRELAEVGYLTLRYTWADVVRTPREVEREVRAAHLRRTARR